MVHGGQGELPAGQIDECFGGRANMDRLLFACNTSKTAFIRISPSDSLIQSFHDNLFHIPIAMAIGIVNDFAMAVDTRNPGSGFMSKAARPAGHRSHPVLAGCGLPSLPKLSSCRGSSTGFHRCPAARALAAPSQPSRCVLLRAPGLAAETSAFSAGRRSGHRCAAAAEADRRPGPPSPAGAHRRSDQRSVEQVEGFRISMPVSSAAGAGVPAAADHSGGVLP